MASSILSTKKLSNKFQALRQSLYLDVNPDYRSTVLLAGTGRSGTTWVGDIINYKNEYRVLFEPFHCERVPLIADFHYRQYLRPDNKDPKYFHAIEAILTGRVRNWWVDISNKRLISHQRLIKDIRVHFLLKWISQNFPGLPIILLLRHPCAVAASKLKMNWDARVDELLNQKDLVKDFLAPYEALIKSTHDIFEKYILFWCLENYVPLKQFREGEIHLCFYENFCIEPKLEIKKMFNFLGKDFDAQFEHKIYRPSSESRKESAVVQGNDLVDSWRKELTDDQVNKAVEILKVFGLDRIYNHASLPNRMEANNFLTINSM